MPRSGKILTANEIRTKLETLTGDNRLDASAIKNLPVNPLPVSRQANCSVAIPNNTAVEGWVVPTTFGSGVVNGDLLYDDGTSTGTMEISARVEGRAITVTDALTGGTITFPAAPQTSTDLPLARFAVEDK